MRGLKGVILVVGLLAASVVYADPQLKKYLTVDEATMAATKRMQRTGNARPIVGDDGVVLFPFGQIRPTVVCAPLHVCDVALQPGERVVSDPSVGQPGLWDISKGVSGEGENKVVHVVVKPLAEMDLETNLIVRTNRRVYNVNLVSRNDGEYMSQVAFYYPNDMLKGWADQEDVSAVAAKKKDEEEVSELSVDLAKVDADYEIRIRGGSAENKPLRAFNDGVRTFIQMPKAGGSWEAGALVLVGKNDEKMLTNYRVKGSWYIVDKVVTHAALLIGEDGKDSRVDIEKKKSGW